MASQLIGFSENLISAHLKSGFLFQIVLVVPDVLKAYRTPERRF